MNISLEHLHAARSHTRPQAGTRKQSPRCPSYKFIIVDLIAMTLVFYNVDTKVLQCHSPLLFNSITCNINISIEGNFVTLHYQWPGRTWQSYGSEQCGTCQ